jgi:hypothetical protein
MNAWLYLKGVTRQTWTMSPGPALAEGLGGRWAQEPPLPGILLSFSSTVSAARTALRIHSEMGSMFKDGVPPMAVAPGGDPRELAILVHDLGPRFVLLTEEAVRFMASEAVETLPGPDVALEGGRTMRTKILPATSYNIGWALPAVATAPPPPTRAVPVSTDPVRREPPVVNIWMGDKRDRFTWPRLPWGLILGGGFAFVLLLGAYQVVKRVGTQRRDRLASAGQATPTEETAAATPEPDGTPIDWVGMFRERQAAKQAAVGFGTVVIRTEPADAQVFVNDRLVGKKSPVTLEKQTNQEVYTLTVKRKGYRAHTMIYNVETDRTTSLDVKLEKR